MTEAGGRIVDCIRASTRAKMSAQYFTAAAEIVGELSVISFADPHRRILEKTLTEQVAAIATYNDEPPVEIYRRLGYTPAETTEQMVLRIGRSVCSSMGLQMPEEGG